MLEEQRPREKALRMGVESLSDMELLCLIISSGTKNKPVDQIAQDVLKKTDNLARLTDVPIKDLMKIEGIREVKALQIASSIELCKRALKAKAYSYSIHHPEDAVNWFEMEYGTQNQENFVCLFLDTKGMIITHKVLFKGSLNESLVHPREIFKEAFLQNAYALLFVHNHPSNDVNPSQSDRKSTHRLVEVSKTMGIPIMDHIIVGRNRWYSFKQHDALH